MITAGEPPADVWVVVRVAPNLSFGEMLREVLTNEGLLVMLRSVGPPHMGPSSPVEVLVPRAEVRDALEVLNEVFSRP